MSCFRTSPTGWFSAFSFSSLDSKSDDVGCAVYRNGKKKEGKKFPTKKMHPLSLFPLNWPFLNVINAIMGINLGIDPNSWREASEASGTKDFINMHAISRVLPNFETLILNIVLTVVVSPRFWVGARFFHFGQKFVKKETSESRLIRAPRHPRENLSPQGIWSVPLSVPKSATFHGYMSPVDS